jgi:hypothetical protein
VADWVAQAIGSAPQAILVALATGEKKPGKGQIPGSPTRHLPFAPEAMPQATTPVQAPLTVTEPQIQDIPAGVDLRIQDCIVCVPGLPPTYVSFSVPPLGTGTVSGTGQPATVGWWKAATQANGVAIPTQVGDQFRGREFKSFAAFDEALWRTLGATG